MEPQDPNPAPPECFQLAELEAFQASEGAILADVNYYLWLNLNDAEGMPYRFLYFLELLFENADPLLLSSGEDSTALQVSQAETLVKTADALHRLHGKISIQRVNAGALPIWLPAIGKPLEAIRLTKNEQGLYLNDALLLDFGEHQLLLEVHPEKEGLLVGVYR